MRSKLGLKGWDDVMVATYDPVRFIDWIAMCHAEIGHCGMCVDCVNTKPAPVTLEEAA